jgi:hypothetical protein
MTDQHRAFNLALRVMTMVDCSAKSQFLDICELGPKPVVWRNDQSVHDFVSSTFHFGNNLNNEINNQLNAKRLQDAGLKFQGTDDLNNHLNLDRKNGVIQIYHHTTFLRTYLIATQDRVHQMSHPSAR